MTDILMTFLNFPDFARHQVELKQERLKVLLRSQIRAERT